MALLSIVGLLLGVSISITPGNTYSIHDKSFGLDTTVYPPEKWQDGDIIGYGISAIGYVNGLPLSKELKSYTTIGKNSYQTEHFYGAKFSDDFQSLEWTELKEYRKTYPATCYKSDIPGSPYVDNQGHVYAPISAFATSLWRKLNRNSDAVYAQCPHMIEELDSVEVAELKDAQVATFTLKTTGSDIAGNVAEPSEVHKRGYRTQRVGVEISARPAPGFFFDGWYVNRELVSETPVVNVYYQFDEYYGEPDNHDVTYNASFSRWESSTEYPTYHPFKRSPGGGGGGYGPRYPVPPKKGNSFVLVSTFAHKSEYGSTTPVSDCYAGTLGTSFSVTLTATANDGCEFVKWINSSGGLESSDATFTKTLTYPTTPMAVDYYDATAIFKSNGVCKVDITSNLPEAGSETGAGEHYNLGDQLRLEAFPENGYWFLYWTMLTPESPELVRDTVFEEDLYLEYEHFGANYRKCTYQPMDKDGSLLCNSSGQIIFDGNGGKLLQ